MRIEAKPAGTNARGPQESGPSLSGNIALIRHMLHPVFGVLMAFPTRDDPS